MSRNLLFKHGNFLTVFENGVDYVFLQPGNFLNLLLIATKKKKLVYYDLKLMSKLTQPELQAL